MRDRIPVMFDRALRPEWLDFALENSVHVPNQAALRQELREYLRPQIRGMEALNKTVTQLLRVIGPRSPVPREQLCAYHERMELLTPDQRASIRLSLVTEASPFFADCLTAMRRLAVLGTDGVTLQQMYERLTIKYGDRSTVLRQVRYVLQTMALLGVVRNSNHKWFLTNSLPRQVLFDVEDTASAV